MNSIYKLNFKEHISILISLSLVLLPVSLQALPGGSRVVNGNVNISTTANTMNITASNRAIINYKSFNINSNEAVKFIQPNSSSVVLNRVISSNPSSILGQLNANGRIFLVNPAGIYFGKNSVVNANSFLATTLNITDKDFLNNNYNFEQMKDMAKSYIIQKGTISVSPNGFVVLTSPFISNDGAIIAKTGHIVLGASDNFYIQFGPNGLINYNYKSTSQNDKPILIPKEYADSIIDNVINSGNNALKIVKNGNKVELVGDSSVALVNGKIEAKNVDVKSGGYIGLLDNSRLKADGGDITVFANGDAYSSKGASLIAKDGTVEISAKKRVTYDGSLIDARLFYMDPEELIFSDNYDNFGKKFTAKATKDIIVNKGSIITTHGGDIEMDAPNITLEVNSKLLADKGDITLNASSVEDAKIDIQNGVEIEGGNINILATSYRNGKFDSDSDDPALKALSATGDFLIDLPVTPIAYQDATTSSTIDIGSATINGTKINIASEATSDVSVSAEFQTLALAYGKSYATSSLHVKSGATLTSSSDMTLSSEATSINHVSGKATNILKSGKTFAKENIAVTYSDTKTDSSALVDSGVTINAGDFKLLSTVNKDISTSATGVSYSAGLLGTAVAYSNSVSNNNAYLSGNVNAKGVEVTSKTYIDKVKTSSSAGVGNGFLYKFILEPPTDANGILNKLKVKVLQKTPNANPKSSVTKKAMSAAFSYSGHKNYSEAKITDAKIRSNGIITVNSNIEYGENGSFKNNDAAIIGDKGIKTIAIATIDSTDQNQKDSSFSGAFAVTNISNFSNAYIGDNVVLNTIGNWDIGIYSKIYLGYNIDWKNIKNFNTIKDIVPKVKDVNFRGRLFTSYAQSNAQGGDNAYSGSFNDFKLSNTADAYIGKNVLINQNGGYDRVSVVANNDIEALNFAGVIGWTYFGTKAEGTGAGGAYLNVGYTNYTNAYIEKGTKIKATALRVSAIKNSNNLSISTAGGKAKNALSGSFSYLKTNDNTKAYIESSDIVLGNYINDKFFSDGKETNLKVNAEDNTEFSNGTGGVVWGKNVGVGVSSSINDISRDTQAYINGSTIGATNNKYGGLDYVKSYNSGFMSTYALSGTVSTSTPSTDDAKITSSGSGKYDIGISGDGSLNILNDQANAYISNSVFADSLKDISVLAENNSDTGSYSGAGVFAFSEKSIGLAGSFAMNILNNSAVAYIDDSNININNVNVAAQNSGEVASMAGSGTISTGIAGLAGSVAINDMANETKSYINNSVFHIYGNLNTTSLDNQSYNFFAGALAVGKSLGVGLSYGRNNVGNTIDSHILDSHITSNSLYISSSQNYSILGISSSPAAGLSGMAIAASYSDNIINNTIEGYIQYSHVTTNDFSVLAFDDSNIGIYSGTLTGSTEGSVGISASVNEVKNNISAYADYLMQKSSQNLSNVTIKAYSKKSVTLASVGGSFSQSVSGAGGVTINSIKDKVTSKVSNSIFNVNSSMQISATEQNDISNFAGTLSGSGSLGIAGGVSTNIVENEINAYLDESYIEVRGEKSQSVLEADNTNKKEDMSGLDILAFSNETIDSKVANFAGGGAGGVSASISVNLIGDQLNALSQYSYINDEQTNNPYTSQEVRVRAVTQSDISSKTGAVSAGGSGGFGGSVDTSIIKNKTNAVILGSYIKANKEVKTQSDSYDRINSIVVSGSGAGAGGVAGSVAVAVVNNENYAYNRGSCINSNGDLEVSAKDTTSLDGIFAGALAVGGAAGVGASIAVTTVSQDTQAHIDDSKINAKKDTSIIAKNTTDTTTYAANISGGGTAGVGGSITVNTINSNAKAFTYAANPNAMLINQDDAYRTSSQNVNIKSNNHSSINSTPGNIAVGGTAGVGASIDVSTIHNTSLAEVGSNTKIDAGENLLVQAESDKGINSKAMSFAGAGIAGVAGSVLIANINADIDSDSLDASKKTKKSVDQVTTNSIVGSSLGDSNFATQTKKELDSNTKINVDNEFSPDVPTGTTYATIGDNSKINIAGKATVKATDTTHISMLAGVISGGLVGVGGSVSIANVGMDTRAYIGEDVDLVSGSLDVETTLEFENNSINSITGAAGGVGLGAAVSELNVNYENDAYVDEGTSLKSTNEGISVNATSNLSSNQVEANGVMVGVAAAGLSKATYNQTGKTQAIISQNSNINSSGDFALQAKYDAEDVSAHSLASAGGVGSEIGSTASISIAPTVVASLGDDSSLTSGGFGTIYTSATSSPFSKAEGAQVSVGGIGGSIANTTWSPTLTTSIGSNTNINVFALEMDALENTNYLGTAKTNNLVKADAFASSGKLIGVTGASASATSDGTVNLEIGDSSQIKASSNIILSAYAYSKAMALSKGYNYGLFVGGATIGNTLNSAEINLNIDQYAILNAQKIIHINAYSRNEVSTNTHGGTGSGISGSYAEAKAKAEKNDVIININKNSNLYVEDGDIDISAIGSIDSYSGSDFNLISVLGRNKDTASSTSNQNINININENSKLQARNINIKAYVKKLLSKADAIDSIIEEYFYATTAANNFVSSGTNLNIKTGASLIGENTVNLESSQNNDSTYFNLATSTSVHITAALGYSEADLNNHADKIQSNINANKGSSITTKNLTAKTFAPTKNDDIYIVDATMKGPKTVAKDTETGGGVYNSSSLLAMDADIHQRASIPQELQIDKYGMMSTYGEISANIVGDDVVVNDLSNQGQGSISLSSNGDLNGFSTIYLDNKYPSVTINNSSNKNLVINNIDVISENANRSNISSSAVNNSYNYAYKLESPKYAMNINNYGTGNIILKGKIDNYLNDGSIYNKYGNIYATDNQVFKTTNLTINAEHGTIGSTTNSINVVFQRDSASVTPAFSTNSYYGTYLSLKGENYSNILNNNIALSSIKARGDINLNLDNVYDPSGSIMADYLVKDMEAGGNIKINQKDTFASVKLDDGYMSSGIMDQTVTVDPNLIDSKYIASQDSDNIYLKDITQGGGRIDLNGNFKGTGVIKTLSGFRHVSIDNLSDKAINVGAITTASSSDNGFYINNIKRDQYGAIKIKTFGYDFGTIKINSNNGGKVQLTKELSTEGNGYTDIIGNNGIYADSSASIKSPYISLDTTNGSSTGDEANPIRINSYLLDAKSSKDINIHSLSDIEISQVNAKDDLNLYSDGYIKTDKDSIIANKAYLSANGDIVSKNGDAINLAVNNISANSAEGFIKLHNSKDSMIGDLTAKNDIEFTSDKSLTLQGVAASKEGSVTLNSTNDMAINQITAANSVNLNSQGVIKSNEGVTNIVANDATLNANGGIKMNTKINILDATNNKSGDINIKNQGALRVDDLDGNGYSVYNDAGDVDIKTDSSFTQSNSKSIFASNDININANNNVFLSKIKSLNSVKITSSNGNILGNAKVKPTISLEKNLALYAHNGVIGTVENPITVSMKNGQVIIEAGKAINLLSTYISGINKPTGSYVDKGLGLFDNRIVGGTLLEYYYGTVFNNSINTQNANKNIGLPQNIVSPKFKKSNDSYIVGSL